MSRGTTVPLPADAPHKGEVYQHYKGDLYKVHELALHSNDDEWMVVYEPMYENPVAKLFTRPLREWREVVDLPAQAGWEGKKVERFTLITT